ncbi:MAG: fasciclin domain-containing protein [Cyanobacteria bacterium J06621_11]
MTAFSLIEKGTSAAVIALGATLFLSVPTSAEIVASDIYIAGHHAEGEEMNDVMSGSTIVDVASGSESFTTLVSAVKTANLVETLAGPDPYTVFAPTDAAFNQLPDGALEFLLMPENEDLLTQVLTYHVVAGEITSNELTTGGVSALGGGLSVGVYDSGIVINNASVVNANVQASNGIIHAVNRVLVPSALQQQLAARLGVSSLY